MNLTKTRMNFNRRDLMIGAGAAAVPLPAVAGYGQTSEMMSMYRQWHTAWRRANSVSYEDCGPDVDEMIRLENAMLRLPSTSTADLAAKIAAYTTWGDTDLPNRSNRFWVELRNHLKPALEAVS